MKYAHIGLYAPLCLGLLDKYGLINIVGGSERIVSSSDPNLCRLTQRVSYHLSGAGFLEIILHLHGPDVNKWVS